MRDSLIILGAFLLGVALALCGVMPESAYAVDLERISSYALYALLFVVGVNVGLDSSLVKAMRELPLRVLFVPIIALVGTLVGSVAAFYVLKWCGLLLPELSLHKILTLDAGMGYYSITTIMVGQVWGAEIASIALLVNLLRELTTVLGAPLLSRLFGRYAATSLGGATSMDTSLPIIMRTDGNAMVPVAAYTGIFLTVAVPFILSLLLSL